MPQELFDPAVHIKVCGMVRAYVLNNSGTADDVQEILQEGWLMLFKKAHEKKLDIECKIAPYLFGI